MKYEVGDVLIAKQDLIMKGSGVRTFTAGWEYVIKYITSAGHNFIDDQGKIHALSEKFMEKVFSNNTDNSYDYAMGVL